MHYVSMLRRALPLWTFLAGAVLTIAGTYFFVHGHSDENLGVALRDTDTPYTFVKPLLACDIGATLETPSLAPLKKTFTTIIDDAIKQKNAENVSVYFRSLDSGAWTAVNADSDYAPASLMKVPVLMAYLQQADETPNLLSRTVTITEDPAPNTAQDIPPEERVEVGKTYTIDELLRLMTVYSDNRALNVLMQSVDIDLLDEILDDLRIPVPEELDGYAINPRRYSRFFRTLYNATYASAAMSEKALQLLSESAFNDGLVAGVDTDTVVSHKFGEAAATLADGTSGHELHDCGIVYTNEPYVICVMTRGADATALAGVIADISTATYDFTRKD